MQFKNYFLVGGAGFVGSHFVDALLKLSSTEKVTIFDNFSSGKNSHYSHHKSDPRLHVIENDVKNMEALMQAMRDHEVVMHFASNPDISRAVTDPSVDFVEGFYLTHQVLEAMRKTGAKRLIYTSGSGVYGDLPHVETHENHGPLLPISTYGASKLAGEAFISSYCHMFSISALVFRFGNIVGPRQTHGVGFDFIRFLKKDPTMLKILGDGTQSKSYIHIDDVVNAVFYANDRLKNPYEVYNVATGDYITVREIADIVIDCMKIKNPVTLQFAGGDRGWAGDVPIVRLNTDKIRALGWACQKNSSAAIRASVLSLLEMPA